MEVSKQSQIDLIPSKIREEYHDFKFVHRASYYLIFEALSRGSNEPNTLRVLDLESSIVKTNYDLAASFFIKELLHLCSLDAESVVINAFEINERRIAAVIQLSSAIKPAPHLKESKAAKNYFESQVDFKSLIKSLMSEVEFLTQELKLTNTSTIVQPDNVFIMKESGTAFLGDWLRPFRPGENVGAGGKESRLENSSKGSNQHALKDSEMAEELTTIGFTVLKLLGVDDELIQFLRECRENNPSLYKDQLEEILQSIKVADAAKSELRKLLKKNLPSQESKKKASIHSSSTKVEEEKKIETTKKRNIVQEVAKSELRRQSLLLSVLLKFPHVRVRILRDMGYTR